jgi:hypothetical protein
VTAFTAFDLVIGDASTTDALGKAYLGDGTSGILVCGPSLRDVGWPDQYVRTGSAPRRPGLDDKSTIYFNGSTMHLATPAFDVPRPCTLYMLINQHTWASGGTILDGNVLGAMRWQNNTSTPTFGLISAAANNSDLALGAWGIAHCCFDGASSYLQVGNRTPTTGDGGSTASSGFFLAANTGPSGWARLGFAEGLMFFDRHDRNTRLKVIQYLAKKWSLQL